MMGGQRVIEMMPVIGGVKEKGEGVMAKVSLAHVYHLNKRYHRHFGIL